MSATILIVDDDLDTVSMLTAWLQGNGYRSLTAESGRDALEVARQQQPDLILLDVRLPAMDGLEVCRQLRAHPETGDIPVILVTALTPTEARAQGLLAGAVDYITKPVNLFDLSERIAAILASQDAYVTNAGRLLEEMAHAALTILSSDLVWLLVVDPQNNVLEGRALASSQGYAAEARFLRQLGGNSATYQIPLIENSSPLADVMATRHPMLNVSAAQLRRLPGTQLLYQAFITLDLNYVSFVPLTVGKRPVGMLVLANSQVTDLDTTRGRQLVAALGNQAAIAVDYARLAQNLVEQEEMIQVEQAFLNMVLNSMGDGLIVMNEVGQIEYVNNRLLRMAGYLREDVFGQRIDMLFHPDDRAQLLHQLLRGRPSTMKFDQRLYTKSGQVIPVLFSMASFTDIDPDSQQMVLVLSDMTEQKEREQALERQSQQLRALNQTARAITSSLSPREVITQILDAAVEMVSAEGASVMLRNTENPNELVFVATVGPEAENMYGLRVPVGEGIAGWVAREAKSQLVVDASQDARFYRTIDESTGLTTRSLIAVPLIVTGQVIGVLEVINKLSGAFDQVDQDLLESIGSTAAIAIENARLFDQTRRRLNDLGTLLDASAAVSSTLDFGSILELIARRLVDALQVERCLIASWDPESNIMESLAEVADAYWPAGEGPCSSLEQLRLRRAALVNGLPVLAHVRDRSADAADRQDLQVAGHQALLSLPLRIAREIVGLVSLYSSLPGHRFSNQDAERADKLAGQWAEQLGDDAALVWRSEKRLTMLCDALMLVDGVTWVSVEEWDREIDCTRRLRENGFALWTEQGGVRRNVADYQSMTRVLTIAQPKVVTLDDLDADPLEQQWLERTGGSVCLMAPLIIQGRPQGLVKLIESDARRMFHAEEISLCQGISNVVSNAMENAQLYQSLERRAEALEAAYTELQQADQIKDELLQNLSHELQTPLLHILGYAELMHTEAFGPLNDEQRDRMQFIIERVDHLSELVKDIVSVQALQSQKMVLRPLDLRGVLEQAMQIWEIEAEKQAVALALKMPASLTAVRADAGMLTEAVGHLLDNAIKFSPDGGQVEISVHNRGAMLEVRVADQGIGISKEAQQHIFTRFYQADGGAARRFGGTGLGLSIVREIINRHGGDIWVKSKPDVGSTFFFTLPKAETGALRDLTAQSVVPGR